MELQVKIRGSSCFASTSKSCLFVVNGKVVKGCVNQDVNGQRNPCDFNLGSAIYLQIWLQISSSCKRGRMHHQGQREVGKNVVWFVSNKTYKHNHYNHYQYLPHCPIQFVSGSHIENNHDRLCFPHQSRNSNGIGRVLG